MISAIKKSQERINLYKKENVLLWATKFKVSIAEIKTAVMAVGSIAFNVEAHLQMQAQLLPIMK